MREINLPLPVLFENEQVEIKINVGNNRKIQNYKVVSFQWDCKDALSRDTDETSISLARISRLKKSIESYDKSWELIQIFAPLENSEYIRVLYRKKE
jgi:hypothetical protein